MKNITISEFFKVVGHNICDMEYNKFYPIEDWEILSYDIDTNKNIWKDVEFVVRKEEATPILVTSDSGDEFFVSPEHKFYAKINRHEPAWIEAIDLLLSNDVCFLSDTNEWHHVTLNAGSFDTEILDLQVKDTECYYSNGYLSHNTLYGDPTVTSGGKAIPFHASVRIKLGAGSQITNKDKEVIGINVNAKTIKNKVASPFRTCEFEIHFGKGIYEDEQVFDLLRAHGSEVFGDNAVVIEGEGAWKSLIVNNATTGELILEKKFYKAEFRNIWKDDKYKGYIDDLLERAMVKTRQEATLDEFDENSYEEVRALSSELSEMAGMDGIGPEDMA